MRTLWSVTRPRWCLEEQATGMHRGLAQLLGLHLHVVIQMLLQVIPACWFALVWDASSNAESTGWPIHAQVVELFFDYFNRSSGRELVDLHTILFILRKFWCIPKWIRPSKNCYRMFFVQTDSNHTPKTYQTWKVWKVLYANQPTPQQNFGWIRE